MPRYIKPVNGLAVTKAGAATLPTPSAATDGVELTDWVRFSGMGWAMAVVSLFSDATSNITNPKLYAYGPYGANGANQWLFVQNLNGGNAIALTAIVGWVDKIELPAQFISLAVGGTVDVGNVGYAFTPLDEYT
jgi:hypothetical protein